MIKQIDYSLYILYFILYISFNTICRACRESWKEYRHIFQTAAAARAVFDRLRIRSYCHI